MSRPASQQPATQAGTGPTGPGPARPREPGSQSQPRSQAGRQTDTLTYTHMHVNMYIHVCIRSFACSFARHSNPFLFQTNCLILSYIESFIDSFIHSLAHSFIQLDIHSLTYTHTHKTHLYEHANICEAGSSVILPGLEPDQLSPTKSSWLLQLNLQRPFEQLSAKRQNRQSELKAMDGSFLDWYSCWASIAKRDPAGPLV